MTNPSNRVRYAVIAITLVVIATCLIPRINRSTSDSKGNPDRVGQTVSEDRPYSKVADRKAVAAIEPVAAPDAASVESTRAAGNSGTQGASGNAEAEETNSHQVAAVEKIDIPKHDHAHPVTTDPKALRPFGKAAPFAIGELPEGELKKSLLSLTPANQGKALEWLHSFTFSGTDAIESLRADRTGGIFYVCEDENGHNKGNANDAQSSSASPATESVVEAAAEGTSQPTVPEVAAAAVPISSPPIYNSKPGATRHIYLDFNGAIVSGKAWSETDGVTTWTSWDCDAWGTDGDKTTFSDSEQSEMRRVWERISEDYAPFDINVTTDAAYDPITYTGDKNKVGWLLFTPTTDKNGARCPHYGSGGVAYVGVYGNSNYFSTYQPAWVLPTGSANMAEAASHEMGHNMGLSHDGTSALAYYGGHVATGSAPSWGPIMGTGYGRNVSQWSKGEYYDSNQPQDDLTIITAKAPYRTDDHGDTYGTATPWLTNPVNQKGIVERTNNPDVFTFNTGAGSVSFSANTYRCDSSTWGANVDVILELYNEAQVLVASNNPATEVNASISYTAPAGRYYLVVKPSAAGSPLVSPPSGYPIYGSLGQYTITGNFIPSDGIFLSSPGGGESWVLGSSYDITWGSAMGGNVKIELLKGGVLNSTISASTPNDGSYTWAIPNGLTAASDYKVKITSLLDNSKTHQSLSNFSITTDPLGDALDTVGQIWTTSGSAPWFSQSTTTHDGIDAAQSGVIGNSTDSSMESSFTGPGTMTFWWKVSSETNYDFLRFYLNGVEQTGSLARISGNINWIQKTVNIPSGSNVVKWSYTKDGSAVANLDAAWVDQVVFTPSAAPEIVVEQPTSNGLTDGASTINFGSVNTGSSTPLTFTIRNTGTADLTGLALTKSGTNSADYTLGSLSTNILAPGTSTTFTVTFAPGAAGTRTAAIQIASNDADENPFDINLTGTGVGPGSLAVTGAGGLTSSGNYGGAFTPSSVQYTLSNPGNSSINWTAGKTAAWVSLSASSGTLAAGANTTVTVSINSGANTLNVGGYNDTVTFTNTTNSSGNTTRSVALTVNSIPATVTLGNLAQTYDGSPKAVSVVTNPPGLSTSVTYNGSATIPTNAATYAVVATVTTPNYSGSDSKNLVIAKASQTITFGALSNVGDNAAPFALTGSSSSGLALTYASSNTGVATISGNTLTVVASGATTITASQAGNANYLAATSVAQPLTVFQTNLADAVIFEPFLDADSTLTGNASGRGLSGTWLGGGAVVANSLNFGNLPAGTGNTVSINNQNGYASTGSTLGATGLLNDGASLWFSVLVQSGSDIATNGDLGFALGTDEITAGNNIPVANSGQALGFTFKNDLIRASQWTPGTLTRSATNSGNDASANTLYFVVGKITWGATSETIEIYRPAANLTLGSAVSTYTTAANIDQSQFDTISFAGKSASPAHLFDEIRFGASYESVVGLGVAGPGSLAITPAGNLTASGYVGGPFSPNSQVYTLSNPGTDPINWTAAKTAAWVNLSATSGTLAAGTSTTVTATLNSNANALGQGNYNDTITFTNTTNGTGNSTRGVSLTVNTLATYAVGYNGNGNTGGTAPSGQTKIENTDLTLSGAGTLVRTGYTFAGWNTAANGSGTPYASGATYSANAAVTLFAQWTANSYTVTFNPNSGGTPSPTSKSVTYGSTYGTLATISRTGYTFNGWFTAASGGSQVLTSTTVTATANHTLYAQWTIITYAVSYDANQASSGVAPGNQTKTYGVNLTLATNSGGLTRTGYTFSGWNTAADGSGTSYAAGASYTSNAPLPLFAKWIANTYTCTFDANGGSAPVPSSKPVVYDDVYGSLPSTDRTGYNFNGWFTAPVGGSLVTGVTTVATNSNHTLYAQWTQLFVEMNVLRNSVPVAVGSYDALAGATSGAGAKLNYDILNTGSDILTLGSAVISGLNNCSVAIDSQPSATVSPSNLTSLILTATPTAGGAWSFRVSIQNNDPDENPYQWTVYGVAASSTTTSLVAVADTYVANGATTTNYGNLSSFSIFNRTQSSKLCYGLLRFDLSGIPAGATITSASLGLVQSNTNAGLVDILDITGSWTETGATWANSSTLFGSTSFGSESAPGSAGGSVPSIILDDAGVAKVQSWLVTPAVNFGFGIKTTNSGNNTNIDLYAHEHATASNHPKLNLTYTVNPQVSEMDVIRAGSPVADGGADSVTGTMAGSGTQLAYTITNLGNANLTLTTPVSVSSASNCAVVVNSQPANMVAASANTSLVLTVTPAASGAWSANISVANNDPDENPYNWTISGTAASNQSGPVNSFVISAIGSTQTVGTPITGITLTAKDASNNTVTGFTGTVTFGGTGGFSGTSAAFVAGVRTGVSVTPTVAGSNLTFTVNDGASHTGSVTIATIQTKYASWSGGAAFDTDANGDGVPNGLAWVLGASNSSANATAMLPSLNLSSGNMVFSFKRSQASIDAKTAVTIEVGTQLGTWPDIYTVGANTAGSTAGVTVVKDTPSVGTDTITLSVPQSSNTSKFARLKVLQSP